MRAFLACTLIWNSFWNVCGQNWSEASLKGTDGLPVIQVRLAPPKQQLPDVAAETSQLEHLREQLETDLFGKLHAAYASALEHARAEINKLVDGSLGLLVIPSPTSSSRFLQIKTHKQTHDGTEGFSVKVNVAQAASTDPGTKGLMERIEDARATAEKKLFEQACAEMQGLTNIVLHELGAQLHSHFAAFQRAGGHTAFFQTQQKDALPSTANVRIAASSEPFASVADMVEAMEAKRDTAEHLVEKSILELEIKLLEAENKMIKEKLGTAVQKISA